MAALETIMLEVFLFANPSLSQSVTANERIEHAAQLTVRLLGGDGQPVPGNVCLREEDGWETCSATDRFGIFTFFRLAPGSYVIVVFRGSQKIRADQITISDRFGVQSDTIRLPDSQSTSPIIRISDLAVPERARRLYETGKQALYNGEYSKAQGSLQAALSLYPNFPRARNALAITYVKEHDFASAVSQLEIVIQLDPRFGEAYFNYGIVLMDAGKYADAATHLTRALDLEFSPEHVADCLISSDIRANHPDAAVAALHTIHEKNLKHRASLHRKVADYLDALGRDQDAKAQYRQYTSETE